MLAKLITLVNRWSYSFPLISSFLYYLVLPIVRAYNIRPFKRTPELIPNVSDVNFS